MIVWAHVVNLTIRSDIGGCPRRETLDMHINAAFHLGRCGAISTHLDSAVNIVDALNTDTDGRPQTKRLNVELVKLCESSHVSHE